MSGAEDADWTRTPAAIFASVVLGLAAIGGLGWSLNRSIERDRIQSQRAYGTHELASSSGTIERGTVDAVDEQRASPRHRAPDPQTLSVIKRINLNAADSAALDLLPGIGPALASRIIADRAKNGRYDTVDDLERVSGIGPKTVEKLKAFVILGDSPETRASAGEGG